MSPAAISNFSSSSSASSTRWCPTPEQLMILEEMYRAGVRTPNAAQIQHITAQLSFYGKIEGKNVFYWFQNHKARDRQKLRRKLCKQFQLQQQQLYHQNYYCQYSQHKQHQQQLMLNQQSLLGYLAHSHPPPPLHQPLFCHHHNLSPSFLPQLGVVEDAVRNSNNYTHSSNCKVHHEIPAATDQERSEMHMNGHDWVMATTKNKTTMLDVAPPSSPVRPLKTLQLFPIKSPEEEEEESAIQPR